jgi:hypothetical protein
LTNCRSVKLTDSRTYRQPGWPLTCYTRGEGAKLGEVEGAKLGEGEGAKLGEGEKAKLGEGGKAKLGEWCPKVRLSQDRLPISSPYNWLIMREKAKLGEGKKANIGLKVGQFDQ